MDTIYTTIGEQAIQINCHSEALTNWISRNFPETPPGKASADLMIELYDGYGTPFADYHVAITKEADTIRFGRADYLIETDARYRHAIVSVHNDLALKHALMNLYSSYAVRHQWGLLIHSSCVMDNGKAYLFAGHSGAGKSTAAKLSHPRELLSDEATILQITPEGITVHNSPFRSELDTSDTIAASPLAGIYLLNQAIQNRVVPFSKSNGFLQLMDKVFHWSHNVEETGYVLQLMQHLVNTVPVYDLHFQKNNTFWELISS
ncbi:hypothetical protein [Bacillus sp. 3255]|uniref:hypothetical protein n=1 Tax=Bacillus sp. 3255 TaxID=2817904 RepID=UPI00285A6B52|nr:hypothetical protein [Bacillus sp. 3255]MDR6878673.1 hypothetical protein [Bacillus sp. 3255]